VALLLAYIVVGLCSLFVKSCL